MRILVSLGAVLAACAALAQVDLAKPVVTVNGEAISTQNYYKRMELLPGVGRMNGNRFFAATPGYLTLQQLINETLMLQLAKKNGVEPTAAEIEAELQLRIKEEPDYVKDFIRAGLSEAELRHDIKVQLSEFKVATKGVTITDFQVQKYYDDQKRQFTLPKRYRVRLIAGTSAANMTAVDAELAKGTALDKVATDMSEDLSRFDGGLLGNISENALGDSLKTIVTSMKEGAVTPWLKGESGTELKVYLEDILPEEVLKFDDVLKKKIWKKLMTDRGLATNNVAQMMETMRKEAKLTYSGTPFDDQLKQSFGG